jgi:pimeloyl-ACP methyl ester carboxylesterase
MLYSKIEGEGKPFLIIHGFLGMSDNWKSFGALYAAKGFQVHILDLRNHGKSFHSEDFSYDIMAQDVLEYCQNHNLNQVSIIGHSMGGKVAMLFATNYPEMVEKLIVADIGPKYYAPHHQDILAGLNAVDFTSKPDRASVEETLFEDIELEEDDISLLDHPEEVGKQEFLTNFDDIAKTYERVMAGKMQVIADATLDINVTVLNNFVVFNAIDLDLIRQEVTSLGMEGYILRKHQTSAKAQRIFQHQKFCMVYEIMGKISGYSKN